MRLMTWRALSSSPYTAGTARRRLAGSWFPGAEPPEATTVGRLMRTSTRRGQGEAWCDCIHAEASLSRGPVPSL